VASASPPIWALGAVALVFVGAVLSGCATTQDANQRASIQADRTLASRKALELQGTDREVQVVSTTVLNGKDGSAVVAVLRNRGSEPVNDLPIEVGPEGGQPVNARPNVPYFQSHAPAIPPGEQATWVYVSKDPLGSNRAFVRVGAHPTPPLTTANHVSGLDTGGKGDGSSVKAEVTNDTGVPQYDLDVYAVARKGGRFVAAGRANVEHLGVNESAHLTLPVIGDAKGAQVQIFAPQTLFQ
jgi:hypothetical protein